MKILKNLLFSMIIIICFLCSFQNISLTDESKAASNNNSPFTSERIKRKLIKKIKNNAIIKIETWKGIASNVGSYEAIIEKHQRNWKALLVDKRIPKQEDLQALKIQMQDYSNHIGLKLIDFTGSELIMPKRQLPLVYKGMNAFKLVDNDLIRKTLISIVLSPVDFELIEKWFKGLINGIDRMLNISRIKVNKNTFLITGEIYYFREIIPPIHQANDPDLISDLNKFGLTESSLSNKSEINILKKLYSELKNLLPEINKALGVLSMVNLLDKRFEFFRNKADEIEKNRFSDVFFSK